MFRAASRWAQRLAPLVTVCSILGGCATPSQELQSRQSGGVLSASSDRLILVTIANRSPAMPTEPGSTSHGYQGPGPYIAGDQARAISLALARDYDLTEIREWPIAPLKVQCLVFALAPAADRDALLRRLGGDRRVRLAQPLQLFSVHTDRTAPVAFNDPYFNLQRGFSAIDAAGAQQFSRGEGVSVAVIDTGVDVQHPDLIGHVSVTRNYVDADARAFSTDRHGTGVAGIIGAIANNGVGIVGIAPESRLLAYKACQPVRPNALEAECNSFTLAQALNAAIEAHAQIVNLSLGGPADPLLAQLVIYGEQRGMVFVGAVPQAGKLDGFPLDVPGVIAVDESDRSGGSNAVLHAPGREILSLAPQGRYDFASGSSFAAAHVSGALALLRARAPSLDAGGLFALLSRTSTHDADGETIDVCAAFQSLKPQDVCPRTAAAASR